MEKCVCLFLVPRLTPVERPSSLLWSVVFRAVAWVALFSFLCGDFPCATRLATSHPRLKAHENIALVMSSQFIYTW